MRISSITILSASLFVFCHVAALPGEAATQNQNAGNVYAISDSGSGEWTNFVTSTAPLGVAMLQEGTNKGIGAYLVDFFGRLGDSSGSTGLHESRYAYNLVESIHVWTLCVFFGLATMFDLRLLGWTMRKVPVSELSRSLLPWTISAFIVMVITGSLLFYAIPLRSFQSIFFRVKMFMLLLAGLNVWIFHSGTYRQVETWDQNHLPRAARVAGALSLVLWVGIILSGRMIAYNWFDCDRQPQPAIINFLTNCVPDASGTNN